MKKFILIIILLITITALIGFGIIQYRTNILQAQERNQMYESYQGIDFLGTQLISLINKTIDDNQKLGIPKDENGKYLSDDENCIRIKIKFIYKDDIKEIDMEDIASGGTNSFVERYSTATFRCAEIEYHEGSNNVKQITFEEIRE